MGYTTDFTGKLSLSKALTPEQKEYINTFSGTRRMKRDVAKLMKLYNGMHGKPFFFVPTDEQKALIEQLENSGLIVSVKPEKDNRTPDEIYGVDGEFFAMDDGNSGQKSDDSIIDYNTPPGQVGYGDKNQRRAKEGLCQPGLWCQWIINGKNELQWDGGEKFYSYIEWLQYLITNFFQPWGVLLNGEIEWEGEESSDRGKIVVTDNTIEVYEGTTTYTKR